MTSPILLLAGRFLLASALLMALYWVVWRKQATYRAKRMYLLTMPIVALAISLLQVEVYKPEPVVVEVASPPTLANEEKGVDYPVQIFSPLEKNISLTEKKSEAGNTLTKQGETSAESSLSSSPLQEEKKGWFTTLSLDSLLGIAYVLIVLLLCIPFVVNLIQLRRLRCKVSIINHEANNICILMGKAVEAPFSFHRSIFMPLSLTEAQRRMILTHERAHILHRHYLDVWVAEAVTRLLWWNPFLWWARAELRNVHEFEADTDVLTSGEDVYAYQSILIEEVLHGDVVIANGFNHSFIRRRFIEMLQSSNRRMSTLGKASSTAWMLLMAALMCCTMGEAEVIYKEMKLTTEEDDGKRHVAESKELSEYLPDMASQLSNESAVSLIRALGTLNSIKELSPEEYEELKKAYPAETIPSLESINKSVREIKKSLEGQMSESMTDAFIGLNKSLLEQMREKGLDTLGSSKEDEDKVYHFTEKGNLSFTDTNGNEHEYTIKDDEITEEEIEFLINGTSQLTKNAMEAQGAMANALGGIFKSLFSSLSGSISPMTQETYDSLKRLLPADEEVASLEEINKGLEFLKDSIQMAMNSLYPSLKTGKEIEVPMKVYEEPINASHHKVVVVANGEPLTHLDLSNLDLTSITNEQIAKLLNVNPENITSITALGSKEASAEFGKLGENGAIKLIIEYDDNNNSKEEPISSELTPEAIKKNGNALHSFFYHWYGLSEDVVLRSKEEYEAILKDYPELPSYAEYTEIWTNKINEHSNMMDEAMKDMDRNIRIQVEKALNEHGKIIRRDKSLEIKITYIVNNNDNRTDIVHIFKKEPYSSGVTQNISETIHNEEKSSSNKKDEDFISPQWGLELPEGYIRLTEYKEKAKTDATARKQYDQLMSCIRNAQALRKEALTKAFGKKHPRYVSVEESTKENVRKLFQDANIEMLELGAYLLPDGTKVIEDDRLNLMPQSVNYHHGTTYRGTLLRNQAPTMERDKSPNYDAHNEQTWPVYTNVQKVSYEEYMKYSDEPQVFRGEDCTYVVFYTRISYDFHWFHPTSRGVLVNRKTGDQYMIRYTEHFPLDTYLWIHGQQGEYIRMVDVFPPLPKDVTTVDYISGKIPAEIKLSNASPYKQYEKLKVQSMEQTMNIVY